MKYGVPIWVASGLLVGLKLVGLGCGRIIDWDVRRDVTCDNGFEVVELKLFELG